MTASATERAADYHADKGDGITLSSSIARLLVQRTPAHAWAAHPKLNPDYVDSYSNAMDMGTAVHQILLRDERVVVGDFENYRTKAAQDWRDSMRLAGLVPLLAHDWARAKDIANQVRTQMDMLNVTPTPFTQGAAEYTIRFTANGADCRAMIDWLHGGYALIDDLKTTTDASPTRVERHIFNMGYDVRAAFYVRAVEAKFEVTPGFRWVFVETKPPYPVTIFELSPEAMDAAHAKVDAALAIWKECLERDEWPAYSRELHTVGLPPWQRDAWAEVDPGEGVPF